MATNPPQDPRTKVRFTERQWSQEVATAEAAEGLQPRETAYQFSNGRKFEQPRDPYASEEPTP